MNKELLTFLEEIRKQMANRSVSFKSISSRGHRHEASIELQVCISPEQSLHDTIDDALKSQVIDKNLHNELLDACCVIEPLLYFYTEWDDEGELYIRYGYSRHKQHFMCENGVILTPDDGPIGPEALSNRIIKVIYDSFRTMYISDGIILDIPDPDYCLYDDGSKPSLRNFSEFTNFVTNALMLRGEDPSICSY